MTGDTIGKVSAEYRKKRVRRIKKIIITTGVILLLLPTVLSIFLLVKVFSLQSQLNQISENKRNAEQVSEMEVVQAKEKKTTPSEAKNSAAPTERPVAKQLEKKVYLTFEDGPGTQTEKILNVLKKEKIKATFFVMGKEDSYSKKIYKRIVKEGHTLGMHSYSHIYKEIYESADSFTKDFDKIYRYLYKITGVYPEFYRFPGGSSTKSTKVPIQEFIQVLNQKNVSYVDWNVVSPDVGNPYIAKKQMVKGILQEVSKYDTSVVLMQDAADKPMTARALPAIIKELKKENYKLLPIDRNTKLVRHNE